MQTLQCLLQRPDFPRFCIFPQNLLTKVHGHLLRAWRSKSTGLASVRSTSIFGGLFFLSRCIVTSKEYIATSHSLIILKWKWSYGKGFQCVKMGKKCIVKGCKTNYKSTQQDCIDKIKVFRFPSKLKNQSRREKWIKSIPLIKEADIDNLTTPVICEKDWPTGYQTELVCGGKTRPVDPPSVFTGFAPSSIPTPLPKPRSTTTSFENRTKKDDELEQFKEKDRIADFDTLVDELKHNRRQLSANIVSFRADDSLWIQSLSFISGIPELRIRLFPTLWLASTLVTL